MTVGEKIKSARQRASLKQKELAARLGVTYVNISQWESGRRKPKFETLQRIADVLNISVLELVDDIETKIDTSQIRNLHEITDPDELKKIIIKQNARALSDRFESLKNSLSPSTQADRDEHLQSIMKKISMLSETQKSAVEKLLDAMLEDTIDDNPVSEE